MKIKYMMSGRERSAIQEIKKSLERIKGTTQGFRSEGRDLLGTLRVQPFLGALERRGPFRKFIEKRPTPIKDLMEKRKDT